jgi:RNA polymerase sigma factor (sigma-70 family)
MSEDAELLRQYAQSGSETAFAELVGRHLPLVYAAALRQGNGDEALAKDVAQTVFIDLARKASSLLDRELLTGWLYTSTRLAASMAVRGDRRRQLREQIAASMQEQTTHPESQSDQAELRLVLDEAMSELDAGERNAVLIRFFQGKELKEVGSALGISEDAARMRITRALANLQTLLKQRGVTITAAALGTALATEAVAAVPTGLAATITAAALSGTAITTTAVIAATKAVAMTTLKKSLLVAAVAALAGASIYELGQLIQTRHATQYAQSGNKLGYQTSGTAHLKGLGQDITYRFTMAVEGPRWCLRATVLERRQNGVVQTNNFDYVESGYDGNSTYCVRSLETIAADADAENVAVATIGTGSLPTDTDTLVKNLWLGLASHSYFASAKKWLYPLFLGRQAAEAVDGHFAVRGYWSTLPGYPGLPRQVVYTYDFDGKVRTSSWKPSHLSSGTNLIMTVLSQRTDNGLVLPARYRTEAFSRANRLEYQADVVVESVTNAVTLRVFQPALPGPTYISDYRLGRNDARAAPVTYISTNWPTKSRTKA